MAIGGSGAAAVRRRGDAAVRGRAQSQVASDWRVSKLQMQQQERVEYT
jgi:hypothetical protein